MDQAEYDKEYNAAREKLDAEAAGNTTTARADDGKFAKATPEPEKAEEKKPEPTPEPEKAAEPDKTTTETDPFEEIRTKLAKTEKALNDTKAWGTRTAQELAQLKRESDERKRQAERPAILDANPELEAAIKYVAPAPEPQGPDPLVVRNQIIEKAHPGIFNNDVDPELIKGILTRFDALGDAIGDPLECIREITAEKLAHAERVVGKRFAAESAKAAQKNAMSVPGAGGGAASKTATPDADLEAVNRIANMTPAEFEKERRKVLGY